MEANQAEVLGALRVEAEALATGQPAAKLRPLKREPNAVKNR